MLKTFFFPAIFLSKPLLNHIIEPLVRETPRFSFFQEHPLTERCTILLLLSIMKGHGNHSFRAWAVFQCNQLRSSRWHPRALDGPWGWNSPLCRELPLNDPPFTSLLMFYLEHLRGILKVPRLQTCSFRKQQWCCHCAQATTVSTLFWNIKMSPLLSPYGSEGMGLCPGHC